MLWVAILYPCTLFCQMMQPGELLSGIEKLNKVGSVLYIAAHPDDENTRVLSWLSKHQQLRTAYLSITRGEGGQNLIGSEQGAMLGLIRSHELFKARETDGAEQFFTRAADFGYSKNPDETLQKWNRDSVLEDVLLVIRYFKPDIIICRFPVTGEGGHGHHTASALLAAEAFEKSANPDIFPNQVKQWGTWQVKKLYWNTFQFGSNNTTGPDQIRLNVGHPLPLLGKSTGEIAAASRSMHKSQGFGTAAVSGEITEFFKPLKGDTSGRDIFERLDFSWNRFKGTAHIGKSVDACRRNFDPFHPERSAKRLAAIYRLLQKIQTNDHELLLWKRVKSAEVLRLLMAVCGLRLEALSATASLIPGTGQKLTLRLINRSDINVVLEEIHFPDRDSTAALALPCNKQIDISHHFNLNTTQPLTSTWWFQRSSSDARYVPDNKGYLTDNGASARFSCGIKLRIAEVEAAVILPVQYKWTDPVKGELIQDVEVLPPVTVTFPADACLMTMHDSASISLTVQAHTAGFNGKLSLIAEGLEIQPAYAMVNLSEAGKKVNYQFTVSSKAAQINTKIMAVLEPENGNKTNAISIQRANYDHLPPLHLMEPAGMKLVKFNCQIQRAKIGYIPGSGDEIPGVLKQLGYQVTILPATQLDTADLSAFSVLITGVRAYNVNDQLAVQHEKLMNFVKNGGNMIVQYNTNNRVGPLKSKIGPSAFEISRNRVTDENAPVKMLLPTHPVFKSPNLITNADFEGWVQERGVYFADQFGSEYSCPLGFNDPGESQQTGSLIITQHGKGNFVYTGLSFFRQLPAGVPGAIRLFVNLLHLPPAE